MPFSWEIFVFYAFPPFSMIWPTINKIPVELEKAFIVVSLQRGIILEKYSNMRFPGLIEGKDRACTGN